MRIDRPIPDELQELSYIIEGYRDDLEAMERGSYIAPLITKHGPQRKKPITERQAQALAFITKYSADHGYAPLLTEIAAFLGIKSNCAVHRLVSELESRGRVVRHYGKSRGIEVVS